MSPEATDAGGERKPFRILFVCTGNTCRSPMAEAVARRLLEERGWSHVEVASAGASTLTGLPVSEGAMKAAASEGIDLSDHGSAQLTRERVEEADLILAMTPSNLSAAEALGGEEKSALLGGFAAGEEEGGAAWAVPDPFGGDEAIYRETFESLERLVRKALDRLTPELSP